MSQNKYLSESDEYTYDSDQSDNENDLNNSIIQNNESTINTNKYNFKFVTLDNVQNEIDSIITDLKLKLNYSYDEILNLLIVNNWNIEKIFNSYLNNHINISKLSIEYSENSECLICCDMLNKDNIVNINECNHLFCNDCFKSNYTIITTLKCPMYKCNNLCNLSIIEKYVDDETYTKYKNYIIKHYINNNKQIIYCPSKPFCGNIIIKNIYTDSNILKCKCEEEICFRCKEISEEHAPVSCTLKKKWNKILLNESIVYIKEKCKNCPWCDNLCEKVSGCNFLTCKTSSNKHWCWLCGDKVYSRDHTYTSISGHTCSTNTQLNVHRDKEIYHFKKYESHRESLKLDKKNMNEIQNIINKKDISYDELDFINKSYKLLLKSRNYIQNIYIYSYFEFNIDEFNPDQNIFNINKDLTEYIMEFFASALDLYINDTNKDNYNDLKNKSKVLTKRLNDFNDIIEIQKR